ncbi:unnamed protein product [Leptosia nina]|uniref:Uncharacterized protein n=1 Tax=Leptosia nina TaxID=320188 RepID=A0AAV1JHW7_9NEOP
MWRFESKGLMSDHKGLIKTQTVFLPDKRFDRKNSLRNNARSNLAKPKHEWFLKVSGLVNKREQCGVNVCASLDICTSVNVRWSCV